MGKAEDTGRDLRDRLLLVYRRLLERHGPQHWWPAEEPFEVMVGAILTQSAAWSNVEKAMGQLKAAGALSPGGLRDISPEHLSRLVYSSGYYNAKAAKLKALVQYLGRYGDDLAQLFAQDVATLRQELLTIHGIGEETADSILLYAGGLPVFVIDAYTVRLASRLGVSASQSSYQDLQGLFMGHLPAEPQLFNEYHALIVRHTKEICRKHPLCPECCLQDLCAYGRATLDASAHELTPLKQ